MLFCSQTFFTFFLIVFSLYWITPWQGVRVWLLLAASFFFYICWNRYLAALIGVTSLFDYLFALGMEQRTAAWRRRLLLILSLIMNLGLLVTFKYANFFLQSFVESLQMFGLSASVPLLQVILPVGISFYTFEAINYTVDVYRRKIPAERNPGHFLLFILFFPHLVAGPIVRAKDFLKQIKRPKHWSWPRLHLGVQLFVLGLLKKIVVADHLAPFVDPVYANPGAYSTQATWFALLAYAFQIYGDFSGYSDMALGTAHMLGYKLARNFNLPYLAANISEFWHRWHISLSSWLRDYLFVPLGGSRAGPWRTARNLLVTMTLGGLWHGASFTFVLWGLLHGLLLIGHRTFRSWCQGRTKQGEVAPTAVGMGLRIALTFLCVSFCWVLFRAQTLQTAGLVFRNLLTCHAGLAAPQPGVVLLVTLAGLALGHFVTARGLWRYLVQRLPGPALGSLYAVAINLVLVLSAEQGKTFIYFQF